MKSVFDAYQSKQFPYIYAGEIHLHSIAGGKPRDPEALRGHYERTLIESEDRIRKEVSELAVEEGITLDEAITKAAALKVTGFHRDKDGLYVGGYQLKALLKEAANVAASEKRIPQKWGQASEKGKSLRSWFPEHVFVREDHLHLGVPEPTEVETTYPGAFRPGKGYVTAIQHTEIVRDADLKFTLETDYEFSDEEWAAIWLTAERLGLGAAKPMGHGTFKVTSWELQAKAKARRLKAA